MSSSSSTGYRQLAHAGGVWFGRELSPAKRLFFVTNDQLDELAAREVPVRLTAELLQVLRRARRKATAALGVWEGGRREV